MLRRCLILICCALLAACATSKTDKDLLDSTLESYAAVIRWGNFEDALSFVDPEALKAHPVTALDLARYKQVQVTAYEDQPHSPVGEMQVRQVVEIGIVNINTQAARGVIDRQLWRYDAKAKRWWLMSGLPDITQH